jgi:dipeptidyl-peptidase-4
MKAKTVLFSLLLISFIFSACTKNGSDNSLVKVTKGDYKRAESMLSSNTSGLISGATVRPVWLDADRFWYRNSIEDGSEYILVNTIDRKRDIAFDHKLIASSLSKATGNSNKASYLPFSSFDFAETEDAIVVNLRGKRYKCFIDGSKAIEEEIDNIPANSIVSPDGEWTAFIRDCNLWISDINTGKEIQLTEDGEEDYGYATNNAGWTKNERPVLLWSPDSKKIATFRHDSRYVGEMYLVTTNVGHPELKAWKYPLPGDSLAFRIERIVIHIDDQRLVKLQMDQDQHRSTTTDHIAGRGGTFLDVEWNSDSDLLSFVSTSRYHKDEVLRIADPETGIVKDVLKESEETFFESGHRARNWRVLFNSGEAIWYSQRDNWGHLYLYDLESGLLKNRITEGEWKVSNLLKVDEESGKIYFMAAGKEAGDPYFEYLYSINMDGSDLVLHTPDSANHEISLSPGGDSFIDYASTPADAPISYLRYFDNKDPFLFERADISKLVSSGWVAPSPFSVKARDGKTDLYGLLHKPSNFDPEKNYPIVVYIYPGPQSGSVGSRSFAASRSDRQAIAELGFIVIALDAMGTPMRSKSFHEAYYGNMGDNGLPDQVGAVKQLAKLNSWIDIDRVGIYGHSGGGFASTAAILRYPDFFKVAVSGAGNHDNRNYEDDWGEKWQGKLEKYPDGTDSYNNQANQLLAKNLKGKLLLAHGTMDSNVPPYNTLLVVNELIAANKDFDLILFPNRGHGFGNEPYMMRRRWDYFVKHLLGAEPPEEYQIGRK